MNSSRSTQIKVVQWLVWIGLALTLFLPIYVNSDLFFPYITSKAIVFRTVIEITFLLWFYLMVIKRESLKIDWSIAIFFFYLVVMFGASYFGVNFKYSFWSINERSEGLLLWIHLFAYLLMLRTALTSTKQWRWMLDAFFLGAQIVAVIGLFQYFGVDFINRSSGADRVASTIGNAAFLAGYMLFAIFIGLYLSIKRKNYFAKWYYWLLALVDIFIILQTATRGAFLGILASLVLFFIYNLFKIPNKKVQTSIIGFATVMILILVLVFANRTNPIINRFFPERILSISITEKTARDRLMTWGSAWQGFLERPILGYGQENFAVVFNVHFNPKIYTHAGSRIWFDRAHNIFIDHLITGGFIGLVFYLWLVFYSPWLLLKRLLVKEGDNYSERGRFNRLWMMFGNIFKRHSGEYLDNLANQMIFLAFIAFFVQGVFVFESFPVYLGLFLLIAFVSFKNESVIFSIKRNWLISLAIIYFVCFPLALYYFNIREYQANKILIDGYQTQQSNPQYAYNRIIQAIDMNTSGQQEYRQRLADLVAATISNKLVAPDLAKQWVAKVNAELEKRIVEYPADVANYLLYMRHLNNAYVLDSGVLDKVIKLGDQALKYSPTRPQIYYEIGYAHFYTADLARQADQLDKFNEHSKLAEANFVKAIELNPDVAESYANILMVMAALNNSEGADYWYQITLKKFDTSANPKLAPSMSKIFERAGLSAVNAKNFDWAAKFLEKSIELYPNDNAQRYINLSLIYANSKRIDDAIKVAEKIREIFGTSYASQADAFIMTLKDGTFEKI